MGKRHAETLGVVWGNQIGDEDSRENSGEKKTLRERTDRLSGL